MFPVICTSHAEHVGIPRISFLHRVSISSDSVFFAVCDFACVSRRRHVSLGVVRVLSPSPTVVAVWTSAIVAVATCHTPSKCSASGHRSTPDAEVAAARARVVKLEASLPRWEVSIRCFQHSTHRSEPVASSNTDKPHSWPQCFDLCPLH